jgi:glycosyltransferase involved in cell wall biosynthesis
MLPSVTLERTVWLLNPYAAGSHMAWAEGYAEHSRYRVRLLTMPGYFWKWRMHGGALELAEQARAFLAGGERPDVVLATSMTNLPAFLALMRRELSGTPVVLYMHENQLTYPPPPHTKRDLTYGMIQYLSMLAADRVCFNSRYHMESWFDELPRLLRHFPDYTHLDSISTVRERAKVLPVGCDLRRLDRFRHLSTRNASPPLILWNQRWEYDKDPQTMLAALYRLADSGLAFRVALAGESFRVEPEEFVAARDRLGSRVVHYGYAANEADYARLLWSAHVVLSTAIHEFFGVSVVEALYCGARPVLPQRLNYPELVPVERYGEALYDGFDGLVAGLTAALRMPCAPAVFRDHVSQYDWAAQAPVYDNELAEVMAQAG